MNSSDSVDSEEIPIVEEVQPTQSTLLKLLKMKFLLTLPEQDFPASERASVKESIMTQIRTDKMAPYLVHISAALGWPVDGALLASLQADNAAELKTLDEKIEDAKTNAGESEVREGFLARANFYFRIGAFDEAVKAHEETLEKTIGSSSKIDVVLALIRLSLAFEKDAELAKYVDRAKVLVSSGGDWERKNLLQVYEAVHLMKIRNFAAASKLFIDSVATFTCYELMSYEQFLFYASSLALLTLDRVSLKSKILQSPEVLGSIDAVPNLRPFLFSFHKCQYQNFFQALCDISPQIVQDPYLAIHMQYFVREIRIRAYTQFLASYRSASLQSMADAFGVSLSFIDGELFRFISAGRIHAKIDKIAGVVETSRPDKRNVQYQEIIKQGDLLINKIQKLTKVVSF